MTENDTHYYFFSSFFSMRERFLNIETTYSYVITHLDIKSIEKKAWAELIHFAQHYRINNHYRLYRQLNAKMPEPLKLYFFGKKHLSKPMYCDLFGVTTYQLVKPNQDNEDSQTIEEMTFDELLAESKRTRIQ